MPPTVVPGTPLWTQHQWSPVPGRYGRRRAILDIAGLGATHHRASMVAQSLELAERTDVHKRAGDNRDAQSN